jgi:elongation factor Ts
MANISASDVKALREKTGAGMMECKNALVECNGDFAAAEKLLKEKGLAALEKRVGRATNEGKIFVKKSGDGGPGSEAIIVEMASETDFVARNPEFIALGEALCDKALAEKHIEPTPELHDMVAALATKIRENMSLKRLKSVKAGSNECIAA